MAWPRSKPSSTERGLGHAHQKERARLLAEAVGRLCPYHGIDPKCPGIMTEPTRDLHLDHGRPRALGGQTGDGTGRIAHGACNQRAGARLAHRLRAQRKLAQSAFRLDGPPPVRRRSRDW